MPYLQREGPPSSTRHALEGSRFTIGRLEDNDIVLPGDMRVSRHHARVEHRGEEWILRDLRSRNGTFLNEDRVSESSLRAGDRIKVGGSTFVFNTERDPFATVADDEVLHANARPILSVREREILVLLAQGSTDQQIAEALFISLATVRSHLDRIRDKTGCRRRPELTRLAIELGLVL